MRWGEAVGDGDRSSPGNERSRKRRRVDAGGVSRDPPACHNDDTPKIRTGEHEADEDRRRRRDCDNYRSESSRSPHDQARDWVHRRAGRARVSYEPRSSERDPHSGSGVDDDGDERHEKPGSGTTTQKKAKRSKSSKRKDGKKKRHRRELESSGERSGRKESRARKGSKKRSEKDKRSAKSDKSERRARKGDSRSKRPRDRASSDPSSGNSNSSDGDSVSEGEDDHASACSSSERTATTHTLRSTSLGTVPSGVGGSGELLRGTDDKRAGSGGGSEKSAEAKAARARAMVPMRPEEHEAQQQIVREVFDEETGRTRLVRGTGEIMERIVSREEHRAIQQHASRWGWDYKNLSKK